MQDMETLIKKAGILVEALPYIQKLFGKIVVVKYGGNAMLSEELKHSVMEDVTLLKYIGMKPVIVHGGGPDISAALSAFGVESKFVGGLRVTDKTTMDIAQMVLVGKTNKEIVAQISQNGGTAGPLHQIIQPHFRVKQFDDQGNFLFHVVHQAETQAP